MNGKGAVLVLSALFACVNVASAGLGFGRCPKTIQAMRNFDVSRFAGHWFEYSSFDTVFEASGKCVQASYTLQNNGTIAVVNSMVDKRSLEPQHIRGTAKLVDSTGDAKLSVTLEIFAGMKGTSPLWILGTDYDNYAIAYSCIEIPFLHFDAGWFLTRQPVVSADMLKEFDTAIRNTGLNPAQFKTQVQDCGVISDSQSKNSDCTYGGCKNVERNDSDRKNGDCGDCKDSEGNSDYSDCGCGYPHGI